MKNVDLKNETPTFGNVLLAAALTSPALEWQSDRGLPFYQTVKDLACFRQSLMLPSGILRVAANGLQLYVVAHLKTQNYDNRKRIFRSTKDC